MENVIAWDGFAILFAILAGIAISMVIIFSLYYIVIGFLQEWYDYFKNLTKKL